MNECLIVNNVHDAPRDANVNQTKTAVLAILGFLFEIFSHNVSRLTKRTVVKTFDCNRFICKSIIQGSNYKRNADTTYALLERNLAHDQGDVLAAPSGIDSLITQKG